MLQHPVCFHFKIIISTAFTLTFNTLYNKIYGRINFSRHSVHIVMLTMLPKNFKPQSVFPEEAHFIGIYINKIVRNGICE